MMQTKESPKTSIQLLSAFSEFIASHLGIYFKEDNLAHLEKKLIPMAHALGYSNLSECLERLLRVGLNDETKAVMAYHITIGETYFFRDQDMFRLLEHKILPKLIQDKWERKEIRIWSSACCTGEELYSLAILLNQLIPDIAQWNVSLIGTDINREFLKKAEKGVFAKWSLRGVSNEIIRNYFTSVDEKTFAIKPQIKKLVKFYPMNLVEEVPPKYALMLDDNDLIFACNVLYYFSTVQIIQVIQRLQKQLIQNGILIVSPVEIPLINHPALHDEHWDNSIVFRKSKEKVIEKPPTKAIKPASKPQAATPPPRTISPYQKPKTTEPIQPNFLDVIQALVNKGEIEKAMEEAKEAQVHDPLNANLYYVEATLYMDQNENQLAIKSLEKALFLDSEHVMAYFLLGNILAGNGDKTGAKKRLQIADKLLQQLPSNEIVKGSEELRASDLLQIIKNTLQRL